jgi:hypothetical protein
MIIDAAFMLPRRSFALLKGLRAFAWNCASSHRRRDEGRKCGSGAALGRSGLAARLETAIAAAVVPLVTGTVAALSVAIPTILRPFGPLRAIWAFRALAAPHVAHRALLERLRLRLREMWLWSERLRLRLVGRRREPFGKRRETVGKSGEIVVVLGDFHFRFLLRAPVAIDRLLLLCGGD